MKNNFFKSYNAHVFVFSGIVGGVFSNILFKHRTEFVKDAITTHEEILEINKWKSNATKKQLIATGFYPANIRDIDINDINKQNKIYYEKRLKILKKLKDWQDLPIYIRFFTVPPYSGCPTLYSLFFLNQ